MLYWAHIDLSTRSKPYGFYLLGFDYADVGGGVNLFAGMIRGRFLCCPHVLALRVDAMFAFALTRYCDSLCLATL